MTDRDQRLKKSALAELKLLESAPAKLQEFHRVYKLVLLEHHPALYYKLGRIAGNPEQKSHLEVLEAYKPLFVEALEAIPTRGTRTNALEHALGHLRGKVDESHRKEVFQTILRYQQDEVSFETPLQRILSLAREKNIRYLEEQKFFSA